MASNWEERLRPQNATGKMSNRFDYIYPPPANFAKESEKLKREGNDCLQRPTTTGQDSKTKKQIQGVSGSFKHCVRCCGHGKHNKHIRVFCFTNNDKNQNFPTEPGTEF